MRGGHAEHVPKMPSGARRPERVQLALRGRRSDLHRRLAGRLWRHGAQSCHADGVLRFGNNSLKWWANMKAGLRSGLVFFVLREDTVDIDLKSPVLLFTCRHTFLAGTVAPLNHPIAIGVSTICDDCLCPW